MASIQPAVPGFIMAASGRVALRAVAQAVTASSRTCWRQAGFVGAARTFSSKPNPSKSPYKHGAHRSNAEELVSQYPVIEVEGTVALCDGGGGALGHPIEFMQLNNVVDEVTECKYCGLRYKMKHHH